MEPKMNDDLVLRWSCGEPVKEDETYASHIETCVWANEPSKAIRGMLEKEIEDGLAS